MARILVVDEAFELRAIVERVLRSAGHEVVCAANGLEALRRNRDEPADIVVSDIFMPDMDGVETILAIRREFPEVKVIAMSGNHVAEPMLRSVAARLGAVATLQKPFTPAELLAAVAKASQQEVG